MSDERTQFWRVRTPEGVAFSFRLASPALRAVALSIDGCVVLTAWSVLSLVIQVLQVFGADLARAVSIIAFFILSQGYRIGTEWLWRGQTIGKRVMRLRVVDETGLRLTFAQIALRNLLRFVDTLPAFYLVGGVAALVSRRAQRLGDLAAGTLVIWQPAEFLPDMAALKGEKYNSLRSHPPLIARLRQSVTPEEARAAWQALARRDLLEPAARVRLFTELADYFRGLTPFPVDAVEGVSDEQLVRNIVDILFLTHVE
jgi:uncharacterized RDD family membrane protein YckC